MESQVSKDLAGKKNCRKRESSNDLSTCGGSDSNVRKLEKNETKSTYKFEANRIDDSEAIKNMFEFIKSDRSVPDTHSGSDIASFYKGRSIFITGASGFVGKCLLEKLLRSCPDVKNVYILMRPKRGKDINERMDDLLESELFNRLHENEDGMKQLNKIKPIRGDITLPLFGLSNQDINLLCSEVTLVFHSAATVKFAEPLQVAVKNNVVSVENLINLATKLNHLEALVHVSTAYSNCDRKLVDESFYETPIEAENLINLLEWMKPDMLEKISPILLGNRPNTYTFTKAVAEAFLAERSRKLLPNIPIAMVRPSIVAGIWRQPICGWVDNFNGPTGVILSLVIGAIPAMLAVPNYCADIVPVDIVANLIICAAWQVHQQHCEKQKRLQIECMTEDSNFSRDITIFNCVSGNLNPVAWKDVSKNLIKITNDYPLDQTIRNPSIMLIPNEYLFYAYNLISHASVAYIGDLLLKLTGQKTKFVKIYMRMNKMISSLKPFTTNQWLFKSANVTNLYNSLNSTDKELFNFDVRQIRWDEYVHRYYVGSKLFAMKDDPNKLVASRQKLRRMRMFSRVMQILILLIAYYIIIRGSSIENQISDTINQVLSNPLDSIESAANVLGKSAISS